MADFDWTDPLGLNKILGSTGNTLLSGAALGVSAADANKPLLGGGQAKKKGPVSKKPLAPSTMGGLSGGLFNFPSWDQLDHGSSIVPDSRSAIQKATDLERPIGEVQVAKAKKDLQTAVHGPTANEDADPQLVRAMDAFDADPSSPKPGDPSYQVYRDHIKYRIQGLLNNPTFASFVRKFDANPYEAYRVWQKQGEEGVTGMLNAKAVQNVHDAVVGAAERFLAANEDTSLGGPTEASLNRTIEKNRKSTAGQIVRGAVGFGADIVNPTAILQMPTQLVQNPKEFGEQMWKGLSDVGNTKATVEEKTQSVLTWFGILYGGYHLYKGFTAEEAAGMKKGSLNALETLDQLPDFPEKNEIRQFMSDTSWIDERVKGASGPAGPPDISAPDFNRRRPFNEERARQGFEQKLLETGKVDPVQARDISHLVQERGRSHVAQGGGSLEDFWGQLVPEIVNTNQAEFMQAHAANPEVLHQAEPFFSHAERTIEQKLPNKGTAEQMRQTLLGAGVKADELRWTGLEDLFADRAGEVLTKADVRRAFNEGQVVLGERTRSAGAEPPAEYVQRYADLEDQRGTYNGDRAIEALNREFGFSDEATPSTALKPRYSNYQLKGGSNYREVLLTLPEGRAEGDFHTGHFDEPNILAHVRMNDRVGASGERVLHVEEIQSDWHQEGRDKGYGDPDQVKAGLELYNQVKDNPDWISRGRWDELTPEQQDLIHEAGKTPAAPFSKTWHELAMKRTLRYAAENDYDRVTWTTGDQQSARFDLGSELSSLTYDPKNQKIRGVGKDGQIAFEEIGVTPRRMEELVGKATTRELLKGEGDRVRVLKGAGLRTTAPGMKAFYDEQLPRFVERYAKKWGAAVEDTQVDGHTVHSVRITPEMRRALVDEGQPLFQRSQTGSVIKGAVDLSKDKAVIHLFESGDVSTVVHELGHTWRRQLMGEDLAIVEDWLKVEDGKWTRPQEERFARGLERYLMKGEAPSAKLAGVFERFRNWLRDIYKSIRVSKEIDVQIPARVREVFDRMFNEELIGKPREAELATAAAEREQLASIDPQDPRLDPFADEYDEGLVREIQDRLGGEFGDKKPAGEILREIHERMSQEQEKTAAAAHTQAEVLDYIGKPKSGASSDQVRWFYDGKKGGWYPDYRQKVGWVDGSDFPEHVQRMIDDFRDHVYRDPEYRLVHENVSRQYSGGSSRPPEGAATVSEFASREAFSGEQGRNRYPVPLLQAFREYIEGGGGKSLDQVLGEIHAEDAAYWGPKENPGSPVAGPKPTEYAKLENAAQSMEMADLERRAQLEKKGRDEQKNAAKRQARIDAGEETMFEKRARLAAERLAKKLPDDAPDTPQQIEEAAKETDVLFQEDTPIAPQMLDDIRDVAAGMLDRGVDGERVYYTIRGRYNISTEVAKEAIKAARKLIRMAKAEGEIPKAAPRIVELHNEGLNFQDISRVLADEFPELTKNRYKRAWTEALNGAGLEPRSPRENRYTFLKSEMDKAAQRIQEMHADDRPFFAISEMLSDDFPAIPKAMHEEAFARAMRFADDPVATRIDEKGTVKVFLAGKSISVPLETVADVENFATMRLMGLRTESRIVDRLSNWNARLREWLVENREKAVTAMVRERADWRAQLLEHDDVAFLRKDREASELVQKFGEGIIGEDDLKAFRPDDWQKIVKADEWFRSQYEELLQRVNEQLIKFGQKPIPRRKNYYTHFQEEASIWQRLTDGVRNRGGMGQEILDTGSTRASQGLRNTKWNPFAQRRLREEAQIYDALGAFESYLDPTLAQIHLTKPAMRRRVLARTLEGKADFLREMSSQDQDFTTAANQADKFAQVLNAQADHLVGSRSSFDKALDREAGLVEPLGVMAKGVQYLARRAAASKIVGSLRSAIMQTSGLALAVPELGTTNLAAAAAENARAFLSNVLHGEKNRFGGLKEDPVLAQSDFLARRYADTDSIRKSVTERMIDAANYPMEFIEQNVAETIWRAAYDRAKLTADTPMGQVRGGLGLDNEAAAAYADRITERILAGRAEGEKPIVYHTTWGKTVFQFQLEQGNFLEFLGQDFAFDNGRRLGRVELAWKMAKLTAALYTLNTMYEQFFGATPLPDFARTAKDEYEILTSELDPIQKVQRAVGRLAGEALSAVPGGPTAAGLLPESNILGTRLNRKQILGDTEAGTYAGGMVATDTLQQLLSQNFMTVLVRDMVIPAGGTQIQRFVRGVDAVTDGALSKPLSKRENWFQAQLYNMVRSGGFDTKPLEVDPTNMDPVKLAEQLGKRKHFAPETLADKVRAIVFGPTGTMAAKEYFDKEKAKDLKRKPGSTTPRIRIPGPG